MTEADSLPWIDILRRYLEHHDSAVLRTAYTELSQRYREGRFTGFRSSEERLAYLIARLPATYAVNAAVLSHIDLKAKTVLDLGCGPGTASLAAASWGATSCTLVEQDRVMLSHAAEFCQSALVKVAAQCGTLARLEWAPHDVVVASYVLGELSEIAQRELVARAWQTCNEALVLIEPGTPQGFARIKNLRLQLLDLGAFAVAPCTHRNICPLLQDDWCHFSARVPRTSLHRYLKGADLSYEDEKYSFFIASKKTHTKPEARIIKAPRVRGGHVLLDLCREDGLKNITIGKNDKADFRAARKAKWGDGWPVVED